MGACKDCFHREVCGKQIMRKSLTPKGYELYCRHFKFAANVVEGVKCKDCIYYTSKETCVCHQWLYDDINLYVNPDDFCSYGERRDTECLN